MEPLDHVVMSTHAAIPPDVEGPSVKEVANISDRGWVDVLWC